MDSFVEHLHSDHFKDFAEVRGKDYNVAQYSAPYNAQREPAQELKTHGLNLECFDLHITRWCLHVDMKLHVQLSHE